MHTYTGARIPDFLHVNGSIYGEYAVHIQRQGRGRTVAAIAFAGLAALEMVVISVGSTSAQEFNPRMVNLGKNIFASKATCSFCHGWSGDGKGAPRAALPGLSLRETPLAREDLIEVVQCGRPGTRMPHHDGFAYRDDRCYGVTGRELGRDKPDRADKVIQKREIAAVVEYLLAKVVGRGPITVAECEEYFQPGAAACDRYVGN